MPYGDEWRTYRRAFNQYSNEQAVSRYEPQVVKYTAIFLKLPLDAPDDFLDGTLVRRILNIVYGFDIRNNEDPHLVGPEKAIAAGNCGVVPW